MSAKNWCFTINNYDDRIVEHLQELGRGIDVESEITYIVFQQERGTEGTDHIQGYVQFSRKRRMIAAKEILGVEWMHLEIARGNAQQNKDYCTKEETRVSGPFEYGVMTGRGQRSDLRAIVEFSKDNELTEDVLFENFPDVIAKYPRFVERLQHRRGRGTVLVPALVPQPGWQTILARDLSDEPDHRKIIWLSDPIGGTGKSTFVRRFGVRDRINKYIITGGKHADIYYAYKYEKYVFFDLARARVDSVPYEVMENFKNGYFLSTKYEVRPVTFNTPHVVVFANFEPDRSQLSADRWDIRHLSRETPQVSSLAGLGSHTPRNFNTVQ